MSNQAYTNQETPYWLARTGVEAVSFIKQAVPPLSWLNRGVLYELNDGVLYFDGAPVVVGGSDPTFDSVTLTPVAANPGGADTFWTHSPDGRLRHGGSEMENYDPASLWVCPTGVSLANGADGAINNPLSTITEALTLVDPATGTTINVAGDYSGESFILPAQTVLSNEGDLSFRTLIGAVTASGASWTGVPPFGYNQSSLNNMNCTGLITFTSAPMNLPLLTVTNSVVSGGIAATGNATGNMLVRSSVIASTATITDCNCEFVNCQFGLLGGAAGDVVISHTVAADMRVTISNLVTPIAGTVTIDANSAANVLTVSLIGDVEFSSITVNSVTAPGGLLLIVDDIVPIIWGGGAQANTVVQYIKKAPFVGYTPAAPGDWSVVPTQVSEALDSLAATGTGDVNGPAASTDNAVARFDGVTGKLLQDSAVTIADTTGTITVTAGDLLLPATSTTAGRLFIGGQRALHVFGTFNAFAGFQSGNFTMTGNNNAGLGTQTLISLTSGSQNTAAGSSAGTSLTTGSSNTFLGWFAGALVTTGGFNVYLGAGVGNANSAGTYNFIGGSNAGASLTAGDGNVIAGGQACVGATNISRVVALGRLAGNNYANTETDNILLANAGVLGDVGAIRIGTAGTHTLANIAGVRGTSLLTDDVVADHLAVVSSAGQLGSSSILAIRNTYETLIVTNAMTPYAPVAGDEYLFIDPTAGNTVVDLPLAANGKRILILSKYGTSVFVASASATGGDTINGTAGSYVIATGQSFRFMSDGVSNWFVTT